MVQIACIQFLKTPVQKQHVFREFQGDVELHTRATLTQPCLPINLAAASPALPLSMLSCIQNASTDNFAASTHANNSPCARRRPRCLTTASCPWQFWLVFLVIVSLKLKHLYVKCTATKAERCQPFAHHVFHGHRLAGCSPCLKCISYPPPQKNFHLGAEVPGISQVIFLITWIKSVGQAIGFAYTQLSKVCIYAVPARHTLMRQLFQQRAWESVGGDAAEFVAAGQTRSAGPQRGWGDTGGAFPHNLMKEKYLSRFLLNNEF